MHIVSANGTLRKANQVKHKVACTDIPSLKKVTGEGERVRIEVFGKKKDTVAMT